VQHYELNLDFHSIITIIESGVKNEIYNIAGGFEQSNINTVKSIFRIYNINDEDINEYNDYYQTNKINQNNSRF
jgi:dTDP-D-glucose 4,6-dehydratase